MAASTNAEKMRLKYERVQKRNSIRLGALIEIARVGSYDAQLIALKAREDEQRCTGKPGRPWGEEPSSPEDLKARRRDKVDRKLERSRERDAIRVQAIASIALHCRGPAQSIALQAIADEKATIGKPGLRRAVATTEQGRQRP